FGILANDAFYAKHPRALFPTKFYGYHAGQDLETFANEKPDNVLVPFYAVADGTITYLGTLSGYGGVILEKLSDGQHTALYGHIKLPSNVTVGDSVQAGQLLSYLGNNFSNETSGERKHLHFAIHIGTDLYFHGHEPSLQILHNEWEDPLPFLKNLGAIEPGTKPSETSIPSLTNVQGSSPKTQNIFGIFLSFLSNFFKKL
ncbi:MAG: M23 family metallopeptidase, partial [Candidatus Levyibacteriota bacterium]